MAYYLGRDVKVAISTENTTKGIGLNASSKLQLDGTPSTALFAQELTDPEVFEYALADITGVDLGISVTDEDITYLGLKSVLKAEIKKETSITLTRKKSGLVWDVVFNGSVKSGDEFVDGTVNHGARWGVAKNSVEDRISNGLFAPKDHLEGTDVSFGYRIFIQMKNAEEVISIPGCQITGHTISLNADGTTEETMEFISYVDPKIGATANVARLVSSDM